MVSNMLRPSYIGSGSTISSERAVGERLERGGGEGNRLVESSAPYVADNRRRIARTTPHPLQGVARRMTLPKPLESCARQSARASRASRAGNSLYMGFLWLNMT